MLMWARHFEIDWELPRRIIATSLRQTYFSRASDLSSAEDAGISLPSASDGYFHGSIETWLMILISRLEAPGRCHYVGAKPQ